MKNIPKKIWLQIGEDCDCEDFDSISMDDITWCVDKINDNDIGYVLQPKIKNGKVVTHPLKSEDKG